jgi:hypothetical protein
VVEFYADVAQYRKVRSSLDIVRKWQEIRQEAGQTKASDAAGRSTRSPGRMMVVARSIFIVAPGDRASPWSRFSGDDARPVSKGEGLTRRADSDSFDPLKVRAWVLTSEKGVCCARQRRWSGPARPLGNEGHLSVSDCWRLPLTTVPLPSRTRRRDETEATGSADVDRRSGA